MSARPVVLNEDEGELLRTQVERLVKARAADTDGALAFTVVSTGEGFGGPPLHRHLRNSEAFYILEGRFRFRIGDEENTLDTGALVFVPPGTPHAFTSADGKRGRMIEIFSPADFEGYFDAIAAIAARGGSPADVVAAQHEYGMEVLGQPLGQL